MSNTKLPEITSELIQLVKYWRLCNFYGIWRLFYFPLFPSSCLSATIATLFSQCLPPTDRLRQPRNGSSFWVNAGHEWLHVLLE